MLIQTEFQTLELYFGARMICWNTTLLIIIHRSWINTDEKPTFPYFFLYKDMQCVCLNEISYDLRPDDLIKKFLSFQKEKSDFCLSVRLIELINNALRDCPVTMITWTTMLCVSCGIHFLAVSAIFKVYTIHTFRRFIRLTMCTVRVGMSESECVNGLSLAKNVFSPNTEQTRLIWYIEW